MRFPVLLTVREVATLLGVKPCRVHDLVYEGTLPARYPRPRLLRVLREDALRLKAQRDKLAKAAAAVDGLTVPEVAAACNVTPFTIRRWIKQGIVPACKVLSPLGGTRHLVRPADLQRFLAGMTVRE
jgi:predicted site-specific integrase-resolvase